MNDKFCKECGYNKSDKFFCKKVKIMELEKLKLKRKEFVSYALTRDNGDDYYDDVDKINNQIEKLEKELNFDNFIK